MIMAEPIQLVQRLIGRTHALKYDEHDKARVLVRDSWVIARKLFGEENAYLNGLKSIAFLPKGMLANRENEIMTGAWNGGLNQLKDVLHAMKLDLETSEDLRKVDFRPPEKITLQWLFHHMSWQGWLVLLTGFLSAFSLGIALANTTFIHELFRQK